MIIFENVGARECTIKYGAWKSKCFIDIEDYIGNDKVFTVCNVCDWKSNPVLVMDYLFDTMIYALYSLSLEDIDKIRHHQEWLVEFTEHVITFRNNDNGLITVIAIDDKKEVE